jgi:mono/diheme cytochrome c family protein
MSRFVLCAVALLLLGLTPAEKRGRAIYRTGDGAIAVIGGIEVGAGVAPCANCHGFDGRGIPEGSIEPPDVRWATLSAPNIDRRRPRYDAAALRRAVVAGVDAGGNPLSPVMPRYRIEAMDDLVAYLQTLGEVADPGLSADAITIATAVPSEITRAVIEGWFRDVNASGGIYGRRLELGAVDSAFAIVCTSDPSLVPLIAEERIPVITPLPATPSAATMFFLFSDAESQSRALETYLAENKIADATAFTPVPTLPTDVTPEALQELRAFASRHQLPSTQLATQIATHATMKVFLEGLKRAGRDLTREKLLASLERLYQFPTGLTPPITYGRNHHTGASGAYILDKKTLVPVSGWVGVGSD